MAHAALDVAKYFLNLAADPDAGELVSNLKLQKLCYYAQGFALAILDRPIFGEAIEAWQHGPVVPAVWRAYKEYAAGSIPADADFDPAIFDTEERDVLDEVWRVYGQFSAWRLRDMTHEEPPWNKTPQSVVISHEKLKAYFKTQID